MPVRAGGVAAAPSAQGPAAMVARHRSCRDGLHGQGHQKRLVVGVQRWRRGGSGVSHSWRQPVVLRETSHFSSEKTGRRAVAAFSDLGRLLVDSSFFFFFFLSVMWLWPELVG
ncbi:pollen-specific leucine-rich repeat extensin-like protein 4 [Iris pallida]|uniref:Pollen-specific leucine-rich repeat extensin-like protein 4 n=1 Tax=Iris pallida TaxID=29817 RepID=A0AAX6EES7_IRIPA|nr:pollen-specific leucine-rich repeat extensin-like protein 4 [Iris pallida]KAJ6847450.1 pollen-specific leucine-rich repeat extensin-like protein 4 [Iris pallida]